MPFLTAYCTQVSDQCPLGLLLSDPPWGGSKAGQEGFKQSFKDKRLYLECCHSGSGFGQIFQGVDPGRGKNR